ncbi:MAG TPA: hypothetical protein VGH89_36030 [Pseudonocardia sp.]|jgi:hypothetical protein
MDDLPTGLHQRTLLLATGYTDRQLRGLRERGEISSIRRGTYLAGPPPDHAVDRHRLEARATMEHVDSAAVLSHASAAVWHRLPVWRVPLRRVQIVKARDSGGRRHATVHLYTAPLRPDEIAVVDGLPVTAVARTVVDLARVAPFESGVVTADAALALGVVDEEELRRAAARCAGWPGAPRARQVVAFADRRSESVGESRSRVAMAWAGLPAPIPQWPVHDAYGELIARVDFWWPDSRTVGEFDGRTKYGGTLRPGQNPGDAVFAEKRREDSLRAENLTVVRWTWHDIPAFTTLVRRALRRPPWPVHRFPTSYTG